MSEPQPGILADVPTHARYLSFSLHPNAERRDLRASLSELVCDETLVIGIGPAILDLLGASVPGLRGFPSLTDAAVDIPATQMALWCWIRGEDRGDVLHAARSIERILQPALSRTAAVDGFRYKDGLDLTGYEDGTENPVGETAREVAIVAGAGTGLDGGSFVAVQRWVHDLDVFDAMAPERQDDTIGRRRSDNSEISNAPESAHVKRTAQEDFEPEAFVVRRSMPWTDADASGLMFVAFGAAFDAFEAQLRRMVGHDDGIVDALFTFTHPVTGSYFWCPPTRGGRIDLSALTGA